MIYIIKIKPYKDLYENILNIYNESVLIISYTTAITITLYETPSEILIIIGWVLIVLVGVSLIITWSMLGPGIAKEIYKYIKTKCKREEATSKAQEGENEQAKQEIKNERSYSFNERTAINVRKNTRNEAENSERSGNTLSPDFVSSPTSALTHIRVDPKTKTERKNPKNKKIKSKKKKKTSKKASKKGEKGGKSEKEEKVEKVENGENKVKEEKNENGNEKGETGEKAEKSSL